MILHHRSVSLIDCRNHALFNEPRDLTRRNPDGPTEAYATDLPSRYPGADRVNGDTEVGSRLFDGSQLWTHDFLCVRGGRRRRVVLVLERPSFGVVVKPEFVSESLNSFRNRVQSCGDTAGMLEP